MIPAWNMAGVIPPIRPGQQGGSSDRSPYIVPLAMVMDRFALSSERGAILLGLLAYRAALHGLGIVSGFQWLDGSFVEDIEMQENSPPNDIDVVTYFNLPPGDTQITLATRAGNIFDHAHVKNTYHLDSYSSTLGGAASNSFIRQATYWYSMWSHRRDGMWKGFVQVDLDPAQDAIATSILTSKLAGGTSP